MNRFSDDDQFKIRLLLFVLCCFTEVFLACTHTETTSQMIHQETIACGGGAHLIAVLLLCTLGEQAIKRMSDLFARQMRKIARQQREDMIAMIMQLQTGLLMPPPHKVEDKFCRKVKVFNGEGCWRDWACQF